ncbi:hypothetical protein HZZ13_14215 [Bradyrhizobium sp. CNPSo 4010]|uniref:Uncharacterized protein n=1 Tax=Bradyrhizobium agreste TaxID=2751811 RepID=A0ABS0PP03_9BRAD|nr:hypothetical protein [Bradyrhizobium agreste]MBH5398932.1 hypothetical protein [Bradyrhizobium agreste]
MMDICGFLRWCTDVGYRSAGLRIEPVDEWRDSVICGEFKAIREAKERACGRR